MPWIPPRTGGRHRHAFGFDQIMANPDYHRFANWYARTSFFAPERRELDAMLSQPEAVVDKTA